MQTDKDSSLELQVRILFVGYFVLVLLFGVNALLQNQWILGSVLLILSVTVIALLATTATSHVVTNFVKLSVVVVSSFLVIFLVIHSEAKNMGYLWSLPIFIILIQLLGSILGGLISFALLVVFLIKGLS